MFHGLVPQVNVARDIAIQMCDVFEQKDYVGIVNVPYMAAATLPHMKPFMRLSETLGAMLVLSVLPCLI